MHCRNAACQGEKVSRAEAVVKVNRADGACPVECKNLHSTS